MSPTELEMLRDALHCLRTYRGLTRGTQVQPFGRHGHPIDTVISNLELVISKHDIPQLKPIQNRPVKLNEEIWK